MPRFGRLPILLALALTAGCSNGGPFDQGSITIDNGALVVEGGHVSLRPTDAPSATVDASGSFSVDGKPVDVTPTQRALFRRYYAAAAAVRQHGIDTGEAGARVAGAAIEDAVSSIFHGDTAHMDKKVDAQSAALKQATRKICTDLATIQTTQDSLAAQLPAFGPYGQLIRADSVGDCRKD